MTLYELFAAYEREALVGATKNTVAKFRMAISELSVVVERIARLEDLTDSNLAEVARRKLDKGRSPATANVSLHKLAALWTFAHRDGLTLKGPRVKALTEPERNPTAWSREQLDRLFRAAEVAPVPVDKIPGKLWWPACLSVLWDTGERCGAIIDQARWDDLLDGVLLVPAAHRKGKTRDKLYTLHPETVCKIDRLREYGSPLILPWPLHRASLFNQFRGILKRAGLPSDRWHMLHAIRRSVASHAAKAGADASALLDHADSSITRRYYIDRRIVPAPRAIDVLFRPAECP
jgi:integrase